MRPRRVHIVGAGLAGLSAAIDLVSRGVAVSIYESAPHAGGRCRSYFDPALGMDIDNGNHLILSGNHATLSYLDVIGARDRLYAAPRANFPFVDIAMGSRWTVRANDGPIPWWVFDARRRPPGTRVREYLALARLLRAAPGATIGETMSCEGPLYDRLIRPLLLAALNIEPPEGSARLAAAVFRETLVAGGRNYHPMVARHGLSDALVAPAVRFLEDRGTSVAFGRRLRALNFEANRVVGLDFGDTSVALSRDDAIVLAVPPSVAGALIPTLTTPTKYRAIVNAHFRLDRPAACPPITGVINGQVEWLFAFPGRLSVTISAADRLLDMPREQLAASLWSEVAAIAGASQPMPTWQIVRETRATFAATPEEETKRPPANTAWTNLALAGDWTQTGLPATIEGAIRSGVKAALIAAPAQG
jgi:squalene-associated FAD-dependent desaturase